MAGGDREDANAPAPSGRAADRDDSPAAPVRTDENATGSDSTYLRSLIDHAADAFILIDAKGRIVDVNQRACRDTAYTRAELLQMEIFDLSIDTDRGRAEKIWDHLQHGDTFAALLRYRRKDGSFYPVDVRVSCHFVDGRKTFLGLARDISDHVEAERAIRLLNEQLEQRVAESTEQWRSTAALLQAVMDAAPDLIYVKDAEGRYLFVNHATSKLMGRARADLLGRNDSEIFPPELARELIVNDHGVMVGGEPRTIEEWAMLGGVLHSYSSNKAPYRDPDGRIIGLIGISRDITEEKKAEAALRQSEARWQFALDGSGDGIWDWNLHTGHVFYSRQWKLMLGYAEEEIGSGTNEWSDRVHPDDLARCWELIQAHLRGETPDFALEHRMRTKGGTWRWIYDRGKLIEHDASGAPLRIVGTHTDITERKQSEAAILELNQRLRLANRVSGVGVWELNDPANARFVWDEQMHIVYGIKPGDFDGSLAQWLARLHPADADRVAADWSAALADPAAPFYRGEFRIVLPTREQRYIRAQAQIFRAADGSVLRALGVNWDITATRLAAEAMQRAKEAAEAAEHAKSEFLAVMSHEIRTPMNTVLGMTRLALQTELAPRQRNYLDKVNASAQTLITIINNILDFSKIEAGKLDLEEAEFALESVLESVSAVTAMKAEEKGLEIAYAIAPEVPTRLIGDSLRLGQVLINLVNNAVKFTERGEVVVSIGVESRHDDRLTLRFAVRDTGVGLDAGQIAGLFRAFSQADSHVSRTHGGSGLGLAICKQLVELMGGHIGVSSEPGKGSTFHFNAEMREPHAKRNATPRPERLSGRRVLVTDDNAAARDILSQMLLGFGMDVEVAESGATALRLLKQAAARQRPFQIVLMDWQMPGMDGLETAQQIRATPELQQMPAVLMVTAYGREEVLRRAEQLGLQGVLIKPVTESTMFDTIADVIGDEHKGERALDAHTAHAAMPSKARLRSLAGRHALVVDDNALNREVAGDFLAAAGMHVATAVDGLDALSQLNHADYDVVLMDIHMPGIDGLTATREIRKQARWATLPIVALTARARPEDRHSSSAAGMNAHLTKPIDEATLYETLLQILPETPASQDHADKPAAGLRNDGAFDLPVPSPHLDLPAALKHLGGKRELLLRLLRSFAEDFADTPVQIAADARGGRNDAIAAQAHAVKGAAAYLRADALCTTAALLEEAARDGRADEAQAHLPRFVEELEAVLGELRQILVRTRMHSPEARSYDKTLVLKRLAQAEPLIAAGDYAAQSLLAEIDALLAPTPLAVLAAAMHTHFDLLELENARSVLQRLREAIE